MQNSELLTLTYGAIVGQIIRDYEDPKEVNAQLEQMGYNMGVRLVDEFCAKNRAAKCRNFKETMETLGRVSCGVAATLRSWSSPRFFIPVFSSRSHFFLSAGRFPDVSGCLGHRRGMERRRDGVYPQVSLLAAFLSSFLLRLACLFRCFPSSSPAPPTPR